MAERVNESQIQYIIDYMTTNKHVLRVIRAGPKPENVLKIKWAQLAKELNSLGPPVKTVVQWQKVWRDLRNIALMKTIRNRSRVATKKISSLIPESKISAIGSQDRVSSVEKGQFSLYNDSQTTNSFMPVSHTEPAKDHEMPGESRSSYSPAFSLVWRRSKRTVENMKKLTCFLRKGNRSILRKSTNALHSLSFSFNLLPESL